MEDSSDDDEDGEDEEFYFYDGGWHSSPRPIKDLLVEVKSMKDSQVQAFDEGSGKNVVGVVESINQSLLNIIVDSAVRVREDEIKIAVNKDRDDDPNNMNHGNDMEFGSAVENVEESDVVVDEVEIRHNDDDAQEITVGAVLLEHTELKEQTNEGDDVNQPGHNDDADLDQRLTTETQTANVVLTKGETNDANDSAMAPASSNQVMVVVSIESVCDAE